MTLRMLKRATYEAGEPPGNLMLCAVSPCKEQAFSIGPPQALDNYAGQGGRVFKFEGIFRCHARHKFRVRWTEIVAAR